jgi:hypothetical protein
MKPLPGEYASIQSVIEGINDFVNRGVPPGDFLFAVLTNNLRESFRRADPDNFKNMGMIVRYLYTRVPAACWGSPENVRAWLDFKQQQRRMEQLAKRTEEGK